MIERWIRRVGLGTQRRPLRQQLRRLIGLCTALTLLLSVLATLLVGWRFALHHAETEAADVTRALAALIAEPLAAGDPASISRHLSIAESQPRISGIWVYAAGQTTPLASWGSAPTPGLWSSEGQLLSARLVRSVPVVDHLRERVGSVTVQIDQHDLLGSLLAQSGAMVLAALLSGLLLRRLARPLAQRISQPLDELSAAATAIAEGRIEQARLPEPGSDEIGRTVAAFQSMLDQIRSRDCTVEQTMALMNQLVEERTAEARRAEAASEAKTRFLTVMSHEIRTPLNGILGMSDLLMDAQAQAQAQSGLDAEQREHLQLLRESARALELVINDVLDYSRIESADLRFDSAPLSPRQLLEQVVEMRRPAARARDLALTLSIDDSVPSWLLGDAARLAQIVDNLLGNAIKFTEQGGIAVGLSSQPQAEGVHELHLSVEDSGVGIAPAQQQRIFEAFSQAADPATRRHGGTGLGLAICARLALLMGGSIAVDSEPGRGSIFHVRLRLQACAPSAVPAAPAATVVPALESAEGDNSAWHDLDPNALLERLGGDQALMGELVAMLVEDTLPRLDELDRAFLERDAARIDLLAHQIAGAAGNCSAEALERLSRRISHLAREGRLDEAERLMLPLKLRVTRLAQRSAGLATA
ncbi:MAG: ATP-binding protein [Sphaerotilus natans subsp. sulfidivorans]|uniref:ATP-binding protein n=1 Tax=Sphaerotilus sulfidivorans TaxID=639200 RepID=UPI002353FEF1|nr:ATP-binding protein [Sphaerotilus sulfidivorans]MCK6403680.1 ATP-binding protein [Sphaerotilus sulfidivorans]